MANLLEVILRRPIHHHYRFVGQLQRMTDQEQKREEAIEGYLTTNEVCLVLVNHYLRGVQEVRCQPGESNSCLRLQRLLNHAPFRALLAPRNRRAPDPGKAEPPRTPERRLGNGDSRLRVAAPAVVRVLMATAACQSGLEGTWSGYKGSEGPISLTFGGDHSPTMVSSGGASVSSIPGGPSVGYETLDEVYPMQLYMVLEMDDRRTPRASRDLRDRGTGTDTTATPDPLA